MEPTLAMILRWVVIIICLLLAGWFILEIVDRIDDDVNTGMIVLGGFLR